MGNASETDAVELVRKYRIFGDFLICSFAPPDFRSAGRGRQAEGLRAPGLPCNARASPGRREGAARALPSPGGVCAGRDGVRRQSGPGTALAANPDVLLPRPLPAAHFAASPGLPLPVAPVLLPVGCIGYWPSETAQCLKKTSNSTDGNSRSIPGQGTCTLLTRNRPSTPKFSGNWSIYYRDFNSKLCTL